MMKLLIYSEDAHLNLGWTPTVLDEVFCGFPILFRKIAGQYSHILSNSLFVVAKQYRQKLSVRVTSSRDTICRIVKQIEDAGIESDKSEKEHRRSPSVRVEEAVSVTREAITISPRKNVRHLEKQTGVSTNTA
jgi:hypothetical protein